MKNIRRIILAVVLGVSVLPLSAQEKRERRPAEDFLPKAGDFAFSISANPLTSYIGNLFNGNTSNEYTQVGGDPYLGSQLRNLQPLLSISGKYMVTDHFGTRINVGWMHSHYRMNFYAPDDADRMVNPLSQKKVIDSYIRNVSGGSFSVAGEYRIGNRRVQGIVGGGLMYAFDQSGARLSYGNAITEINQNPSTGIYPALTQAPDRPGFTSQRYLERYPAGVTHYAGLVAFVGVEWFFCPWVSLGGEVNIAAAWNWTRTQYYKAEGFNTLSGQVETWTELEMPSSNGFDFGTGNVGANITVTFYFNRNR